MKPTEESTPAAQGLHTPGPWGRFTTGKTMRETYCQPFAIVQLGKDNMVAGMFGDVSGGIDVAEANGRLISAAPDLLEALRRSAEGWANAIELNLIPARHVNSAQILLDEALAAIARATGANQ